LLEVFKELHPVILATEEEHCANIFRAFYLHTSHINVKLLVILGFDLIANYPYAREDFLKETS
jgi:hypothetical protein